MIPHILPTKKNQSALLQVQHRLRCYPLNGSTNLCTQTAHHLVAKNLFKLLHAFHIYNKQGKKETIDTLLVSSYSDTWWKSVINELGRLYNGIDNQVRATNTIGFIRKLEAQRGRTVTYTYFVCDYRPLKSEPFRIRLTVGCDRLEYLDDLSSPAASLLE